MNYFTLYSDGNGDGHSAVLFPDGKTYFYHEDRATNNSSEYNGIILALFVLPTDCTVTIKTDSQLACGHLEKGWKVNHEHLSRKIGIIHDIAEAKNIQFHIEWIPRKQNLADGELRKYLRRTRAAGRG